MTYKSTPLFIITLFSLFCAGCKSSLTTTQYDEQLVPVNSKVHMFSSSGWDSDTYIYTITQGGSFFFTGETENNYYQIKTINNLQKIIIGWAPHSDVIREVIYTQSKVVIPKETKATFSN